MKRNCILALLLAAPTGAQMLPSSPIDLSKRASINGTTPTLAGTNCTNATYPIDGSTLVVMCGTDNVVVGTTLTVQGNAFSVGASTLTVANGRLGVLTDAPLAALHVAGDASVTGAATYGASVTVRGGSPFIDSEHSGGNKARIVAVSAGAIFSTNGGADTALRFHTGASDVSRMAVTSDGALVVEGSGTVKARFGIQGAAADNYVFRASSQNGTAMFQVDKFGHQVSSGAIPTLGTCTNGTLQVPSTDNAFRVNFTGANTSCAINFANAAIAGQIVVCATSQNMATPAVVNTAVTGSAVTITATAFANTDYINVICQRVGGQ